ncbi:6-phosphogluconate dehydrogenase, NAD(+)-dependent, decarboxylating [Paenibacillus polymyxa E681]|nr:6-phosphogluconate dehydrogenase, NAD(+)-dependent, decarboxylating [Paenibacillus polymyxa E681]QNV64445.1 6-phosphogluconate dehydrogenase, NAD(+)-dependent, decarboxylating [Paenibacillus polymyxa E681]
MSNTIGVIGLGVMGRNIALNMAGKGEQVAVYNYTRDLTDDLVKKSEGHPLYPYYEI